MSPIEIPVDIAELASAELRTAFQAAQVGSEVLMKYFATGLEMRAKAQEQSYNLVTDADLESEKSIGRVIKESFSSHEILAEEEYSAAIDEEHLWIVDPLDGTNNYAHRIPHFAVSIAYYLRGQAEVGVVVNPARGDWYWAQRGQGAFHNGRRLAVEKSESLRECIVSCGFYYDRGAMMEATLAAVHAFFKQEIHGIRRFGTAALDLCQVADGLFGSYFEYQLHPWDFAAGKLIVEEAGGIVTDCSGEPLLLQKTSILASGPGLHPPSLQIVSQHQP